MTDAPGPLEPETPEDGEEAATNMLVRAEGHIGQSLSEKLAQYYYRMTWRLPFHNARLKGKMPLRLLVAPDDPISGRKMRGMAIRAGHFYLRGERVELNGIDFADPSPFPGMARYIHSFEWLRDLALAGPRPETAPIAERLMQQWLDQHEKTVKEPAWSGEISALRLMHVALHAPLILSSHDLIYRSRVLRHLARMARHLDHVADKSPMGLGRFISWCGVIAASLILPEGRPRQIFGEDGLLRSAPMAFSEEGGLHSRSPLRQMDAISTLAMLRTLYDARGFIMPDAISAILTQAVPPLLSLVHAQGSLSSWHGSGGVSATQISNLIEASRVRARPLRQSRHWGFQRVPAGSTVMVVDAGPPPLARHCRVGCSASTLAFELSHGDDRIVVNCGGAALDGPNMPPRLALALRATGAHSTLCLADQNSTAVLSEGRLGKGVVEVEVDRREVADATKLDMSHDGYVANYGFRHQRVLMLRTGGTELRGQDLLLPAGKRTRKSETAFAIRFHLGRGVEPHLTEDNQGAILRMPSGGAWAFRVTGGELAIDESVWADGDGRLHPTQQLVATGTAGRGGCELGWLFKKMG